jgi:hypothetical protein
MTPDFITIDIAHGHDIAEVLGLVGDDGSLVSQADSPDSRTGVWAAAGKQGLGRGYVKTCEQSR